MTEMDVEALDAEVTGEMILDRTAERLWSETQLKSLRVEEQETIYSFRMFKAIRDDSRMTAAIKTLRDIRGCIVHLERRLKQLEE